MKTSVSAIAIAVCALNLAGAANAAEGSASIVGASTSAMDAAVAAAGAADDAAAAQAPSSDPQIEEVVVTATKRETNLQDTPIAISVLNTKSLDDRHVQSLYDLADGAVPSLRVATFEARQSALTIGIRGIVPLDANQPAREQGVGIYIDGIYLGRQHGLNAALFDVERIEVLKGPQGTLFGRNTEGGALSIVTKAPTGKFGGRVERRHRQLRLVQPRHPRRPARDRRTSASSWTACSSIRTRPPRTRSPARPAGITTIARASAPRCAGSRPTRSPTIFAYDTAKDKNSPFYSQLLNFNPNGCVAGTQAVAAGLLPAGHRLHDADRHGEAAAAGRGGQRRQAA